MTIWGLFGKGVSGGANDEEPVMTEGTHRHCEHWWCLIRKVCCTCWFVGGKR